MQVHLQDDVRRGRRAGVLLVRAGDESGVVLGRRGAEDGGGRRLSGSCGRG